MEPLRLGVYATSTRPTNAPCGGTSRVLHVTVTQGDLIAGCNCLYRPGEKENARNVLQLDATIPAGESQGRAAVTEAG